MIDSTLYHFLSITFFGFWRGVKMGMSGHPTARHSEEIVEIQHPTLAA